MRCKDYLQLIQLSRRRKNSPEDYFHFQRFQAQLLVEFLRHQDIPFRNRLLLDLGCGLGGYGDVLQEYGTDVVALDLDEKMFMSDIPLVHADARAAPFPSNTFDMILCASLIEHVPDPISLMEEVARLLHTGGFAYLSFPPFYSPLGGHQFSPFHLLGERAALHCARRHKQRKGSSWQTDKYPTCPSGFDRAFGNWGLYPRTIRQVEEILSALPLDVIHRSTRWLPIDFSGIPILGEFLTWHVQFILRKR
jgi:SAM-dependent methyltransferase